ncbi:MAG: conjugal transfer protein TrbD [Schwartzia succinivorans]|jgi:type IV secretion system protein VirB3|uniref:VirB3 family type IV secretion system protein n=1 Tax=Schwartzia succinivorans TaxID=55507 RepID=UPI0023541EBA|nr:VirB3 family type IV secretion system protein [Schwartzia succinivorans]MBE6096353.1 conjugal transfer protein TrbD [Schwartzia succinivorans]
MKVKEDFPEGYEIPIHQSLVRPLFWMGVPRNLLLTEVLFAVLGGLIFHAWTPVVVSVIAHYLFRYLGQRDPYFLEVFWRSRQHKNYYYP